MKYETTLSNAKGQPVKTSFPDAGAARSSFASIKNILPPYFVAGTLRGISETGSAVSLDRF